MPENGAKLTVFFQEPFWVGLYERWTEGLLQVCKITFGAEPKDYQVYEILLNHWDGLWFSPKSSVSWPVRPPAPGPSRP